MNWSSVYSQFNFLINICFSWYGTSWNETHSQDNRSFGSQQRCAEGTASTFVCIIGCENLILKSHERGAEVLSFSWWFSRKNMTKFSGMLSSFVCRRMAVLTDSTVILRLSLLQSETCEVYMPSLDFHIAAGTLGGRFTTLEGLLCNIKDQVRDTHLT